MNRLVCVLLGICIACPSFAMKRKEGPFSDNGSHKRVCLHTELQELRNSFRDAKRQLSERNNYYVSINKKILDIKESIFVSNLMDRWKIQNEGSAILLVATAHGYVDVVDYLLNCGSSPYSLQDILTPTKDGQNALHKAAQFYRPEIVEMLLDSPFAREFINADSNGETCLMTAAMYNHSLGVVELLLKSPYIDRLTMPDRNNATVLHYAAIENKLEIAAFILSYLPQLAVTLSERVHIFLIPLYFPLAIGRLDSDNVFKFLNIGLWGKEQSFLLKSLLLRKTSHHFDSARDVFNILVEKLPHDHEAIQIFAAYLKLIS